ncbi:MFS transporter [Pantoea ananatis]|uniref:MFS transporter n=1 Tax=Pantoea ananas TaxID=553 RepID=UPI0022203341|nr:MFS transporter [Pantoea ananatis]
MSASTSSSAAAAPGSLRRSVSNTLKGSAGNLVEWYDVYVYSVFATYFESQFFSKEDKNATLYVWAIFAVTFLMRPIGAWYFGRFADRYGRRLALTVSVSVMAACSFLIAVTPTVASIGGAAAAAAGAPAAGLRHRRRVRHQRHLGGDSRAARLPRSTTSPCRRPCAGAGRAVRDAALLRQGPDFRMGLARGLRPGRVFWLRRTMDESLTSESIAAAKQGKDRSSGGCCAS